MKKIKTLTIICLTALLSCIMASFASCELFLHRHEYSEAWITDDSYHWQKCGGCEEIRNQEEHCWDEGVITVQPTETNEGKVTFTCNTCEYMRVESIPMLDTHEHTFSDVWQSNETHHWYEATCEHQDEIEDYSEHSWDNGVVTVEPTTVSKGERTFTCKACGKIKIEYIPKLDDIHVHEYSTEWSYDEEHHWHPAVCVHDYENKDKSEHNWDKGVLTLEPTTASKGERTFTCEVCGKTKTEDIDPINKRIVFDMNGATSERLQDIICDYDTDVVVLPVPTLLYEVDYYVTGYDGVYDILPIYKNFEGWYIEGTDIKVTKWNFKESDVATTKLVARWSEYIWDKPVEERDGYNDISKWYYKNRYTNDFEVSVIDDTVIQYFSENGFVLYGKENIIEYTITYNNVKNATNINSTKYVVTDNITLLNLYDCAGYEFDCWIDENGNKIVSIPKGSIGDITLSAKWKAKVYTITVKGMNVNPSAKIDSNGNPEYNSKDFGILYYTYGDATHLQGFYIDAALNNELPENYFDDYYTNTQGVKNFTFGGFLSSTIVNNGHTYATYDSKDFVLSADFEVLSVPNLSEDLKVGTLFVLLVPNQYTITLDPNTSSQGALVLENISYSTSTTAYYNEKPDSVTIMPEANYYTPISYATSEGVSYFSGDGSGIIYYDISGDTTMYCQWGQIYTDYTYIYDKTTLESIIDSGKYLVICDIDMENSNWTPIESFAGELDGDEHCIYNFTVIKTGGLGSDTIAFIKLLSETGVIKDLIIGRVSEEKTVKFNIDYDESSSESHLIVGGFVGNNDGTIINCDLINTSISATLRDKDNNKKLCIYVGGIAGINNGAISNCHIKESSMSANSPWLIDTGDDNYGWLGGICAKNASIVEECTVQYTELCLDIRGDGYNGNMAYPHGYLGGVVGEQSEGRIASSSVADVNRTIYVSSGLYTVPTKYNGIIYGLLSGGVVE